jgi:hypothetical protein
MRARQIVENEVKSHFETMHRVRDQEGMTRTYFKWFPTSFGQPNEDKGQDVGFTSGSRVFQREDGVWYEIKKTKNPAYWNQSRYFFMAPGPDNLTFVLVKMPVSLSTRLWRSACAQIYQDATGRSWTNVYGAKKRYLSQKRQQAVVDAADEEVWQLSASGKKPDPAYEIFKDGTWKRVSKQARQNSP